MRATALGLAVLACCLVPACGSKSSSKTEDTDSEPEATLPSSCSAAAGRESTLTLDDFEDGNVQLDRAKNLHGVWYVNNDGTGQQTPTPGAEDAGFIVGPGSPESPAHALHTSGAGFTRWGAFAAAHLNASRAQACLFDLSHYSGIHLSVKGEGSLRANLGTATTTPVVDGGVCNAQACSDYGVSLELTAEWQSVDVPLDELTQPEWASAAPLELSQALRISFWAERGDFDFWLDDLRFYR
jgi:hypothetical protein